MDNLTIKTLEFQQKLIDLVNKSELPPIIIVLITNNVIRLVKEAEESTGEKND